MVNSKLHQIHDLEGCNGAICFGLISLFFVVFPLLVIGQAPLSSVDPAGTEEKFPPVISKFLRMQITETNGGEPCLDEIEVFGSDQPLRNVALKTEGTIATASSLIAEKNRCWPPN